MRITNVGTDYIVVDEDNFDSHSFLNIQRVHLIKFNFEKPNESKVRKVLQLYPTTNRFVIEDNIKTYNYILRGTNKKYYIENSVGTKIITFFKKNNKVLLNFNNLSDTERVFLLHDDCFEDVLRNTEVIILDQSSFDNKKVSLEKWSGNVIIDNTSFFCTG